MERNPYTPPAAVVADVRESQRGRPFAAWVVLVFYALNAVARGLELVVPGSISLPAAELRFYRITGLPRATSTFLSGIFSLIVVIQLYRLKRGAAYFSTASLAVSVFSGYCFLAGLEASEHTALAFFLVSCAVELFVVGYVWILLRKGTLK